VGGVRVIRPVPTSKKQLAPLVPMDRLKEVVRGLLAVPKAEIDAVDRERPKRPKRQRAAIPKAKTTQR